MDSVHLDDFEDDSVVLYFGGPAGGINANTFALALLGFIETAQAVNGSIDPDEVVSFRLERMQDGSYRAVVRKIRTEAGGFLSRGVEAVFWGIVGTLIYNHFVASDPQINVTVKTDEVVIESGTQRVVVPRRVYDAAKNAEKDKQVQEGLRHTFQPLENDKSVKSFGLAKKISDRAPLFEVPRSGFPLFTDMSRAVEVAISERVKTERARLVILKAWLNHSNRKWTFDWNGTLVSAFIEDEKFLDKLQKRVYRLGAGDALDATLVYRETFLSSVGTFIIDHNSFVIAEVFDVVPAE